MTVEAMGAVHDFLIKEHSNREITVQLRNEFAAVLNSKGKRGGLNCVALIYFYVRCYTHPFCCMPVFDFPRNWACSRIRISRLLCADVECIFVTLSVNLFFWYTASFHQRLKFQFEGLSKCIFFILAIYKYTYDQCNKCGHMS